MERKREEQRKAALGALMSIGFTALVLLVTVWMMIRG
jgi:predicted nucleic acid-binding Zn ribbon protein